MATKVTRIVASTAPTRLTIMRFLATIFQQLTSPSLRVRAAAPDKCDEQLGRFILTDEHDASE